MTNQDDKKESLFDLSIIMPAYNEGSRIYANLLETIDIVSGFCGNFEVIVVDDGSTDNTYTEILRAAKVDARITPLQNATNAGKGYALKNGTLVANGEYIAFLDSDLDLSPAQLESFFEMMEKEDADVVIGSKMHPDSKIDYPMQRRIISHIYFLFIRLLFSLNIHDTQTGIKLFKARIIKPAMKFVLVKNFAYDIEVLVLCRCLNAKISEHPVDMVFHRGTPYGRMRLRDLWLAGLDTLAVFYRLHFKKSYQIHPDDL